MESIGKRIRIARLSSGLTQSQLASKIGCNVNTVSRWEHDKFAPSSEDIIALSKILGEDFTKEKCIQEKIDVTYTDMNLEDIRLEVANATVQRMKTKMVIVIVIIVLFFSLLFLGYTFLANRIDPNGPDQPVKIIYYAEGE